MRPFNENSKSCETRRAAAGGFGGIWRMPSTMGMFRSESIPATMRRYEMKYFTKLDMILFRGPKCGASINF